MNDAMGKCPTCGRGPHFFPQERRCSHCTRTILNHVRAGQWVPCLQLDCEEWAKEPSRGSEAGSVSSPAER